MEIGKPAIEVRGVGKRYTLGETHVSGSASLRAGASRLFGRGEPAETEPEFWALREVSFDVHQGEVLGLIGPNGAGKSTLLKMLANITSPTEGMIKMRGRVGTLLEVGTGFHPELTGRENIFLSGSILGMRRAEISKLYDEIVEFSGVEQFLDTPVKRYSSGMHVRLGFAVASALPTDILLVDEVLAVGDGEFQKRCLARMRSIVDDGRTIVFVSHNLSSVSDLCQRAMLIDHGRLLTDGPASEVLGEYGRHLISPREGSIVTVDDGADRNGTGEARLEKVSLASGSGQLIELAQLNEPLVCTATFAVAEALESVSFEVGVSTLSGQRIVTLQSIDGGGTPTSLAAGSVEVSVTIPGILLPAEYSVDVAVHRMSGVTVDHVCGVLSFEVVNSSLVAGDEYRWSVVRGFVRPESQWGLRAI